MTNKTIHLIFGIVISLCLTITGVLFINACWNIYRSGDHPFSPESVAAAFVSVRIPVYITLCLAILGFLLDAFFPLEKKNSPPEKQYGIILQRLHKKLDLGSCDPATQNKIAACRRERFVVHIAFIAVCAVCFGIFLGYAVQPKHFDDMQINQSIVKAMVWFFPCLALPFGFGLFDHYFSRYSIQKEIQLVRQANAEAAPVSAAVTAPAKLPVARLVSWGILLLAVGCFLYGLLNGGTVDVLTKAVNICTECVGLG